MNRSTRILLALALSSLFGTPLTAAQKAKTTKDESKSSAAAAPAVTFHSPASTSLTTPDTSTAALATPLTATVGTQLSTITAASSSTKPEGITSSSTATPVTTTAPISPALTSTSTPSKLSTQTKTTPTIDPITSRSTIASILSLAYTVTPSTVIKGLLTSASHEEQLRQIALRGELDTTDIASLNTIFSGASEEFANKAKERRKDYLPKRVREIFALGHTKDLACSVDTITKLEQEIIDYKNDCEQALQAIESVKKSMADKLQKTQEQLMGGKKS